MQESKIREEYLVMNAYMADYILKTYGVTSDQYQKAMAKYDLLDDPEVAHIMKKNKIDPELAQKIMAQLQ